MPHRSTFLEVVVHDVAQAPGVTGLCAGYELGSWRAKGLADHLMRALPEFCLTYSEYAAINYENAVDLLAQAARRVYRTEKFKNRGEFGELLLHVVLKQVFDTLPAISKIYYKDSANDTVKGFDAVHVIATSTALELWLGEVKFYTDIDSAIRDVVAELAKHTEVDYLRGEFIAIKSKIDPNWPQAERLKRLLDDNVSLDQVFDSTCVPVLLTYDGEVTGRHTKHCDDYFKELEAELREVHSKFASSGLPRGLKLHLFLVPLATKAVLIEALDEKLKAWQKI